MTVITSVGARLKHRRFRERPLRREILRTLLYYDIWRYPLTLAELHAFLPVRGERLADFAQKLDELVRRGEVGEDRGFYFIPAASAGCVDARVEGERRARRMWVIARISAHIIKRFPFVRGVFVSGDLSKHMAHPGSDVDFLILTEPGRLWIARTLLVLFKKIFLLNRKKFFCVNSFAALDSLLVRERNIYQATEIAQLKPLFNTRLFWEYLGVNGWIGEYFPNFTTSALTFPPASERRSFLQRLAELPFTLLPSDRIDGSLMRAMERFWLERYPEFDNRTRADIFRCAPGESRAYAGNYQGKILAAYEMKLRQFGVSD
jgi:hypothetical protein